jgi:hypothetical protein
MKPRRLTLTLALVAVAALVVSAGASANGSKLILTDPFTSAQPCQHKTVVEPDTFSAGSTIVAVAELGLCDDGGALGIGFATSTSNGVSWASGTLPGITTWTNPPGPYDRAREPSVAYDARHNVWIAVSVGLKVPGPVGKAVLASRSTNGGLTWTNPVTIAAAGAGQNFEKPWIVCDNTSTSPNYGSCASQWDDLGHGKQFRAAFSRDGGLTWTQARVPNVGVIGGQPVFQPNGTAIMPIDNASETALGVSISTNGGASWSNPTTITSITAVTEPGNFRSSPLPSAEIDGAGRVFVTWEDCRFRANCSTNDLVYTTSTNGSTWTAVQRIPADPGGVSGTQDTFLPGMGVDKLTSGPGTHVSVTYYYFPNVSCTISCQLFAGSISSTNGGATWTAQVQFAGPMSLNMLPTTAHQPTVGDYTSTSFAGDGTSHGAVIVAKPPLSDPFNVALYDPPIRFK